LAIQVGHAIDGENLTAAYCWGAGRWTSLPSAIESVQGVFLGVCVKFIANSSK